MKFTQAFKKLRQVFQTEPVPGPVVKMNFAGDIEWFLNGLTHREGGPAVEYSDGTKYWYRNGKRHREDGPALEYAGGAKQWFINGDLHREDGPAIEKADGSKFWYRNGERHREDGPAVEFADGYKEWWVKGNQLNDEDIKNLQKRIQQTKALQEQEHIQALTKTQQRHRAFNL